MAPPTTRPRLAAIDPEAIALEVAQALADHVHRTLEALCGLGMAPPLRLDVEELARSPFALAPDAARQLALYAQGKRRLDAPVEEYLITLIPVWSAPIGDAPVDLASDSDPDTDLGCVLRAALAREAVGEGHDVTTPQLAVLAGLDVRQVQQLVTAGELAATREGREYRVASEEARRWLAARGVAGFGP